MATPLGVMFMGSTLVTPLYGVYRAMFRFSELTLTLIYAAYVLGNLVASLLLGRLSDQVGRRRVALPAMMGGALSTVLFIAASGMAVTGVASGMGYRGSMEVVNEIAPPARRAEVLSSYLVVGYLGNSLPVIGVGILSQQFGPDVAEVSLAVTVALLSVVALFTGTSFTPRQPQTEAPA